jgi:hypothetical protein
MAVSTRRWSRSGGVGAAGARTYAVLLVLVLSSSALHGDDIPVGPFCGDVEVSITTQNGALVIDGIPSTCGNSKSCPGFSGPNTPYVAFAFANSTGVDQCVTVNGTSSCTGISKIDLTAYLGSFVPSNVCTNYLGDSGAQLGNAESVSSSVTVPAGATFVVVAAAHRPVNDCGQFCFTMSSVACGVTCPDDITMGTGPGSTQCGANVPFTASASCGGTATCTANGSQVSSGDFFPVDTTTVSCAAGVSQCSFEVTVDDTTPPTAACPAPT